MLELARTPARTFLRRAEERAKPVARWSIGHALPRVALRVAARRGDLQGRLALDQLRRLREQPDLWSNAVDEVLRYDPEVFDDPATFDVTRSNARDHVSFGAGRHYCLGAALARLEGEIGLRAIFERFPGLRPLDGAHRRRTRILRGFQSLPAALS